MPEPALLWAARYSAGTGTIEASSCAQNTRRHYTGPQALFNPHFIGLATTYAFLDSTAHSSAGSLILWCTYVHAYVPLGHFSGTYTEMCMFSCTRDNCVHRRPEGRPRNPPAQHSTMGKSKRFTFSKACPLALSCTALVVCDVWQPNLSRSRQFHKYFVLQFRVRISTPL